jgi:hypothetical protein
MARMSWKVATQSTSLVTVTRLSNPHLGAPGLNEGVTIVEL